MFSDFHLPLSPVDRVNKPPLFFLQVQDGLILLSGVCWTIAYILYIRQAHRDKSYGMPIVTLCVPHFSYLPQNTDRCANITWEFMFGGFMATSAAQVVAFLPWAIIDVFIVHATWKYGRKQWEYAPMVAENLGWILLGGIALMFVMFWTLVQTLGSVAQACFYIAWADQLVLTTTSVAQLMCRGNTGGHSWTIW
ncbi:hypothetical protein F4825DRAFT_431093 [Nemania diffusa]|nr:hypothetical protein F4825DRAFT_431093 [Nemania diffusa]